MSIENPTSKNPPKQETLDPREQLLWASASALDTHRVHKKFADYDFYESEWEHEEGEMKFYLRCETEAELTGKVTNTYYLQTFPTLSHDPDGFYKYDSQSAEIEYCDEEWNRHPNTENVDYTPIVMGFLGTARLSDQDTVDGRFANLMTAAGLDKDVVKETRPFEYLKNELLTKLSVHHESISSLMNGDEMLICQRLTYLINNDFERMEGLSFNDEVISTGDMVFILRNNAEQLSVPTPVLPHYRLRGRVRGLVVSEIPVVKDPNDLFEKYDADTLPDVRPFGLAMVLGDVNIEYSGEDDSIYPSNESNDLIAWIPFDRSILPMERIVE